MGMFQTVVSMVPRTMWHILSVPDGAVDWKWLVELPSSLPKIIPDAGGEKIETTQAEQGANSEKSFFDTALDTAQGIYNKVADTLNGITQEIGTTALMMRAQEVSVPHEQISSTTIRTQARLRNIPDSITLSNLSITFYEDYNYSAYSYLQNWKKAIINDYGVFRCPQGEDGFAKTIKVHVFDTVGLKKGAFIFDNCYPEQIDTYNFSTGENPNIIKTVCSFSTSRASFEPTGLLNLGNLGATAQALYGNITGDRAIGKAIDKIIS